MALGTQTKNLAKAQSEVQAEFVNNEAKIKAKAREGQAKSPKTPGTVEVQQTI